MPDIQMQKLLRNIFQYTLPPIISGLAIGGVVSLIHGEGSLDGLLDVVSIIYFFLAVPAVLSVLWLFMQEGAKNPPVEMTVGAGILWGVWFALVISFTYMSGIMTFASVDETNTSILEAVRDVIFSWRLPVLVLITGVLSGMVLAMLVPSRET